MRCEKEQLLLHWSFCVDLYVCDQILHMTDIVDSLIILLAWCTCASCWSLAGSFCCYSNEK